MIMTAIFSLLVATWRFGLFGSAQVAPQHQGTVPRPQSREYPASGLAVENWPIGLHLGVFRPADDFL